MNTVLGQKYAPRRSMVNSSSEWLWFGELIQIWTDFGQIEAATRDIKTRLDEWGADIRSIREEIHKLYGILYQPGIIKSQS